VAVVVPYFSTAALVAAQTDLVAGVPRRAAEVYCKMLPLRMVLPTFKVPGLAMSIAWHERTRADAGMAFFRKVLLEALRASGKGS
jgi:DNA-binding transcriptional LysR family regulator